MSERYYPDERVTYDEADEAVEEYVADREETKTYVTAKAICQRQGIAYTEHNRKRVHHALQQRFEVSEEWSTKTKKYHL